MAIIRRRNKPSLTTFAAFNSTPKRHMSTTDKFPERPNKPLDGFTKKHLCTWCHSGHLPSVENPYSVYARLVCYLEACDESDREHWIDRGWLALFNHVDRFSEAHEKGAAWEENDHE